MVAGSRPRPRALVAVAAAAISAMVVMPTAVAVDESVAPTASDSGGLGVDAPDPGSEPDPAPYLEAGGRVVVEAERGSPVARSGREWMPIAHLGSVGGAMLAGPDGGPAIEPLAAPTAAPEIGIPILFSSAGTYHVWVRGWAPDAAGDSLHIGLDGAPQPHSVHLTTRARGEWHWFRTRISYPKARVVVDGPGVHTLNVWMREDGFRIDRLVLDRDPHAEPFGAGPPASPRAG